MLRSLKLGKPFGIPLYLHWTFLLLPAWVLLTNLGSGLGTSLYLMVWLAAVFTCVVLHELGHALMARAFGIGTADITLYPIGGVARLERMSDRPAGEIAIAVAGPAVNLGIALLLAPAVVLALLAGWLHGDLLFDPQLDAGATAVRFLALLCVANLVLLFFNLLPCFPMDGGRVLRAALALGLGQRRATEIACRVGLVMAFLIAALALPLGSPMPVVLALFVLFAGQRELMALRRQERRPPALWPAVPQPELVAVPVDAPFRRPATPTDVPFTGVAWDAGRRVWVRWHDGQPVAYWG